MGSLKTKAQSILTEKNTKIIPENIKAGVTIFDITGTLESGSKPNIFCQLAEPSNKDGIWIETNKNYKNVQYLDDEPISINNETIETTGQTSSYMYDLFKNGGYITGFNSKIYFGGSWNGNSYWQYMWYYDYVNNLYNRHLQVQNGTAGYSSVYSLKSWAVDNNGLISMFLSGDSSYDNWYIMDLGNNIKVKNKERIISSSNGGDNGPSAIIDDYQYVFSSSRYTVCKWNYSAFKNGSSPSYEELVSFPNNMIKKTFDNSFFKQNEFIYLMNKDAIWKFDTINNIFLNVLSLEIAETNASFKYAGNINDIFIFVDNTNQKVYAYYMNSNTFVYVGNINCSSSYYYYVYSNNETLYLYCIASNTLVKKYELTLGSTSLIDGINIICKTKYKTKIVEDIPLKFNNIYIYDNNELQNENIYYGNGTSWVKIS